MTTPQTTSETAITPGLAAAVLWRWLFPAALLAVAGASGWMLYSLDFNASVPVQNAARAPDAYMENFVTVEMDDSGRPKRRLEADYMEFHADQTIELSNPHYVLHRVDGQPWHVRSERGAVSANGVIVWLLGKVGVWRDDASGIRDVDIRTEHLTVWPESAFGATAEPVTIRTPATTSTAVGMRAYLDETRIELLSKARTRVDGRGTSQR